jgi:Right handed beta helix region
MTDIVVSQGQSVATALVSAQPGDTILLAGGTHVEDLKISKPGISIIQKSGAPASTIQGHLLVYDVANDFVCKGFKWDGYSTAVNQWQPSPQINGDRFVFEDMEITNRNSRIGLSPGAGGVPSVGGLILRCNIHHNGFHDNHQHGIYADTCSGIRIAECLIHHNGDRGIQIFPDADDILIENNVIAYNGMGVIFGGGKSLSTSPLTVSERSIVRRNIFAFPQVAGRGLIEEWYGDGSVAPTGTNRHQVDDNVIFGGAEMIKPDGGGFVVTRRLDVDPQFVDGPNGNFMLKPGSPAIGYGPSYIQPSVTNSKAEIDAALASLASELNYLKQTTISGKAYFANPTSGNWKNAIIARQKAIDALNRAKNSL